MFPSAQESAKKAMSSWTEIPIEAIFEAIEKRASEGKRDEYFFRSMLSKKSVKELRKLKYHVRIFHLDGTPGFKVTW